MSRLKCMLAFVMAATVPACGEPPTLSRPAERALFQADGVGPHVVSANGSAHWTIPLPNPFDVVVVNRTLSFDAQRNDAGEVSGRFEYHQVVEGEAFKFNARVTCFAVYDGYRAKIGGIIEVSSDPTVPVGMYGWFQVFDNGEGPSALPDQSSLAGFGDEAANEAFCASPRFPRFGPWDVQGNVQVRG